MLTLNRSDRPEKRVINGGARFVQDQIVRKLLVTACEHSSDLIRRHSGRNQRQFPDEVRSR